MLLTHWSFGDYLIFQWRIEMESSTRPMKSCDLALYLLQPEIITCHCYSYYKLKSHWHFLSSSLKEVYTMPQDLCTCQYSYSSVALPLHKLQIWPLTSWGKCLSLNAPSLLDLGKFLCCLGICNIEFHHFQVLPSICNYTFISKLV